MTTKKTTKTVAKPAEDTQPTAEEARERELAVEEALKDMPELQAPHTLRIRHRNRVLEIANNFRKSGLTRKLSKPGMDVALEMGELLADVDDFALSIAVDQEAYLEWSQANAGNYDAFIAILMRYTEAVGE